MRLPQQMYDERLVTPMRQDLTRLGVKELRTVEDVDRELQNADGTTLVVVNSVCGCSARMARPAVAIALENPIKPSKLTTVFAGQDADATQRAREYFTGYPPRRRRSRCSRTAIWCSCSSAGRSKAATPRRSRTIW